MQEGNILLTQVILGNEVAYEDFRLSRLKPSETWQLLDYVKCFNQQASVNSNLLKYCYPEALVELASLLIVTPGLINSNTDIQEFLLLLKKAAKENNCGAIAALLILQSIEQNILSTAEYLELITQSMNFLIMPNPTRDHLFLNGLIFCLKLVPLRHNSNIHLELAFNNFLRASELRSAMSMYYLGVMKLSQATLTEDVSVRDQLNQEAEDLIEKAANLGNLLAIHVISEMYCDDRAGKKLTADERQERKIHWLKQSANVGDVKAIIKLGEMHRDKLIKSNVSERILLTNEKMYYEKALQICELLQDRQKADDLLARIQFISQRLQGIRRNLEFVSVKKTKPRKSIPFHIFHWKQRETSPPSKGNVSKVGGLIFHEHPSSLQLTVINPIQRNAESVTVNALIDTVRQQEQTIAQQAEILLAKDSVINAQQGVIEEQKNLEQSQHTQPETKRRNNRLNSSPTIWKRRKSATDIDLTVSTAVEEETEIELPKLPRNSFRQSKSE